MNTGVALVIDGYVYGVLLMKDKEIVRAWMDPELMPEVLCEKMEFRHKELDEVMKEINGVLGVRFIPEVDPKNYVFISKSTGISFSDN